MRTLIWGDLQAYPYSEWSSQAEGKETTPLLRLCEDTLKWLCLQALEADRVLVLGDLFDRSNPLDVRVVSLVYSWMSSLADVVGGRLRILLGNHDLYSRDGWIHAVPFLEPYVAPLTDPEWGRWGFVHYDNDTESVRRRLRELRGKGVRFVASHNPVRGHRAGYMVERKGVDESDFPGDFVFHGHYHHPDESGRHVFVGAPSDFSFVDGTPFQRHKPPRGAILLDEEADTLQRVPNPHAWQFWTVRPPTTLQEFWDEVSSWEAHLQERSYFRIHVTPESHREWEQVRALPLGGVRFEVDRPEIFVSPPSPDGAREGPGPEVLLSQVVEEAPEALDRDLLAALGRRYMGLEEA